ncbi:MAG: isoprenylcysteine carboxylmethyltransferase family protein [Firmicutes bacterium]|nr:isoprenylcysteine carboxylmethyltransferase family protein [Bacillota bacterium]
MREVVFKYRGYIFVPLAVLILVLGKPTPLSYTTGILLALLGEVIRIWGVGYAGTTTREGEVKAAQLVTAGPYSYVKNPLYIGNFITGIGFCIMAIGGVSLPVRVIMLALLPVFYGGVYGTIIPLEEDYLQKAFGGTYKKYSESVPRIFPRFIPYPERTGTFKWQTIYRAESHTLVMFVIMCILMALKISGG